jgi:hypothetical protein
MCQPCSTFTQFLNAANHLLNIVIYASFSQGLRDQVILRDKSACRSTIPFFKGGRGHSQISHQTWAIPHRWPSSAPSHVEHLPAIHGPFGYHLLWPQVHLFSSAHLPRPRRKSSISRLTTDGFGHGGCFHPTPTASVEDPALAVPADVVSMLVPLPQRIGIEVRIPSKTGMIGSEVILPACGICLLVPLSWQTPPIRNGTILVCTNLRPC